MWPYHKIPPFLLKVSEIWIHRLPLLLLAILSGFLSRFGSLLLEGGQRRPITIIGLIGIASTKASLSVYCLSAQEISELWVNEHQQLALCIALPCICTKLLIVKGIIHVLLAEGHVIH
jgi:ABC-type Fe3+-siderophore transport system permease subunit